MKQQFFLLFHLLFISQAGAGKARISMELYSKNTIPDRGTIMPIGLKVEPSISFLLFYKDDSCKLKFLTVIVKFNYFLKLK